MARQGAGRTSKCSLVVPQAQAAWTGLCASSQGPSRPYSGSGPPRSKQEAAHSHMRSSLVALSLRSDASETALSAHLAPLEARHVAQAQSSVPEHLSSGVSHRRHNGVKKSEAA
ncbi:unnamed protein product [Lampetra planeri]